MPYQLVLWQFAGVAASLAIPLAAWGAEISFTERVISSVADNAHSVFAIDVDGACEQADDRRLHERRGPACGAPPQALARRFWRLAWRGVGNRKDLVLLISGFLVCGLRFRSLRLWFAAALGFPFALFGKKRCLDGLVEPLRFG